jgi:hypothetical protein
MALSLSYRVASSVLELFQTYGRTDGNGGFAVRSVGMRKLFKENEGDMDIEENRQGIWAQVKGHVCFRKLEISGFVDTEVGGKAVRGLGSDVNRTSCFLLKSNS